MTKRLEKPVWKRAMLRGLIAASVLFLAFEALIFAGKTTKIDTAEAAIISLVSGAVYAVLWLGFALMLARMMKEFEARAKEHAPNEKN